MKTDEKGTVCGLPAHNVIESVKLKMWLCPDHFDFMSEIWRKVAEWPGEIGMAARMIVKRNKL
jgi:hypothetical protein